jgi:hypothetical protein
MSWHQNYVSSPSANSVSPDKNRTRIYSFFQTSLSIKNIAASNRENETERSKDRDRET